MKLWKVQKFFGDVVYDLRSRGLLPVAILLVIAMVAVPVLITRGSSGGSSSSPQPAASTTKAAPEIENAVVSYDPGIRDYRRRLEGLSPKNPFRQQFAQSAAAASELNSTVSSTSTDTSQTSSGTSTGGDTTSGTGGGSGKKKHKKQKKTAPTTYTYSVNVLAGDVTTTLTPFNNVPSLTPLPSQTTPVIVFYGLSSDYAKAVFLVSKKVSQQTGPGTCLPAPDDCSLLALGAGQSEDLLYDVDGKTYRIVVAEIKHSAN